MNITNNSVVKFHYSLTAQPSGIKESTYEDGGDPILYIHGTKSIVSGLEEAMEGKIPGDKFDVTIEPTDGYGLRDENLQQRIPAKYLKHEKKLKAGQQVQINTKEGTQWVTVKKVGKFSVDIDANHPFAGQTLEFSIEIVDVREATKAELEHGHADGPGDQHHDH